MKKIVWLFMFLVAFLNLWFANDYIFFYGNWCAHCAEVEEYFEEHNIYDKYNIISKEIYFDNTNREEFLNYGLKLQISSSHMGVPFLLIDNNWVYDYLLGDKPIVDFFEKKEIDESILLSQNKKNINSEENILIKPDSLEKASYNSDKEIIEEENIIEITKDTWLVNNKSDKKTIKERLWFFWIMLPAAIADSINPCEFAIIVLLLWTLLIRTKNRRKVILTWLSFSFAIFVSYFLMGIGLWSAFSSSSNTSLIKIIAWSLGILVWLANLKDVFWHGKIFVMEVPFSRRPRLQKFVKSITSPIWAFFIWLVVSLFLLPCTSGPYITILTFMSASQIDKLRGMLYLFIYNIFFIIPMVLITVLVCVWESRIENLNNLKDKYNWLIHLIVWLLMLGLWVYVFITL